MEAVASVEFSEPARCCLPRVHRFAVLAEAVPAVAAADRPPQAPVSQDIRYLSVEEVEALLRALPDDELGAIDRAIYLAAAMTGLRQGELVALCWRDVD